MVDYSPTTWGVARTGRGAGLRSGDRLLTDHLGRGQDWSGGGSEVRWSITHRPPGAWPGLVGGGAGLRSGSRGGLIQKVNMSLRCVRYQTSILYGMV